MLQLGKKDTHSSWWDLALFALALCFFAYGAININKSIQARSAPPQALTREMDPGTRELASLTTASNIESIKLDCFPSDKKISYKVVGNLAKIEGKACKKIDIESMVLLNEKTNENIFLIKIHSKNNEFTSNYFSVAEGLNSIVWSKGKVQPKGFAIEIIRNSTSN